MACCSDLVREPAVTTTTWVGFGTTLSVVVIALCVAWRGATRSACFDTDFIMCCDRSSNNAPVRHSQLEQLQHDFSLDPIYFHWRYANKFPEHTLNTTYKGEPSKRLLSELKKCHFPWIMLENLDRYPFQWGEGTLEM